VVDLKIKPETNLENLLKNIVAMHHGECEIIEIDQEALRRGWAAWRESARRMAPKLEQLRHDRAQAFVHARDVIIG